MRLAGAALGWRTLTGIHTCHGHAARRQIALEQSTPTLPCTRCPCRVHPQRPARPCRFFKTRSCFALPLVERLYRAILHIVLTCEHDILTQARWVACASSLLRLYGPELADAGVVVAWRPFWDLFHRFSAALLDSHYDSAITVVAHQYLHAHCKMVRRWLGALVCMYVDV